MQKLLVWQKMGLVFFLCWNIKYTMRLHITGKIQMVASKKNCFSNCRRYIKVIYMYMTIFLLKKGFKYFPVYKKCVNLTNVPIIFPPQNYGSPIKININHPLVVGCIKVFQFIIQLNLTQVKKNSKSWGFRQDLVQMHISQEVTSLYCVLIGFMQ